MNESKSQPVLIAMSITTALAVIFGGLTLVAGLNDNGFVATVAGVGMLVVGGINQGLAFYTRSQTVPLSDTAAFRNDERRLVAGPAASVPDGRSVAVVPVGAVAENRTGRPETIYEPRHSDEGNSPIV